MTIVVVNLLAKLTQSDPPSPNPNDDDQHTKTGHHASALILIREIFQDKKPEREDSKASVGPHVVQSERERGKKKNRVIREKENRMTYKDKRVICPRISWVDLEFGEDNSPRKTVGHVDKERRHLNWRGTVQRAERRRKRG